MVIMPQDQKAQGYLIDPKQIIPGTITPLMLSATPTIAAGDLYYSDGAKFIRLPIGTTGQLLNVAAGVPAWKTLTIPSVPTDGWTTDSTHTWVYASASTFTIAGVDLTTQFQTGTLLRFKQGGSYKYAVVASSAFSTNTTVTIIVNTDFTIANAIVTDNYFSYQINPQGFPSGFNYLPSWTGFSVNPSGIIRYTTQGRRIIIDQQAISNGTSNATTLTFSLPVAATTALVVFLCRVVDNNVAQVDPGRIDVSSTTATVYKDIIQTAFTNSGAKDVSGQFTYEF